MSINTGDKETKKDTKSKNDEWVFLSGHAYSGEESSQFVTRPSSKNHQNSNTSIALPRARSMTSEGTSSAECSQSCRHTIKSQQATISQLTETVHQLMKKNHDLEKKLHSSGSTLQIDQSSQTSISNSGRKQASGTQRPKSDSVVIYVTTNKEDMSFISNAMENHEKYPRKRPTSKRHKAFKDPSAPATFEITFEDEQMNKLQEVLSDHIYGDDIFRLFRHFHPNPDQFVSDLKKTPDSSWERLNVVFAYLKKLGYKKFNPILIHDYFVKIEQLKFAQLVEPFLNSDKNPSDEDTFQPSKDS